MSINKIRVYGKAQNRTALGIINAYLVLNPKATLKDLDKAFPASLNSGLGAANFTSIFVTPAILKKRERDGAKIACCFEKDPFTLSDGTKLYLFMLWQKPDFLKIIDHAKQYDIEVADYAPTRSFEKGGYILEYINGYVPMAAGKKKSMAWLWILILLIVLGLGAYFLLGGDKKEVVVEPAPVEEPVAEEPEVVEQVVIEQIKEIQTKFNAVQFDFNKYELKKDAETVLLEVVGVMTENPEVRLNIEGHTSDEGTVKANQTLSENRAKAVADYIISNGIDSSRVTSEGKGSSEPIDPNNRKINRRTEFHIIK